MVSQFTNQLKRLGAYYFEFAIRWEKLDVSNNWNNGRLNEH
jgi:hypothetical protein